MPTTDPEMVCVRHAPHLLPTGRRAIADLFYLSMFGKNESQIDIEYRNQTDKEKKALKKLRLGLVPL